MASSVELVVKVIIGVNWTVVDYIGLHVKMLNVYLLMVQMNLVVLVTKLFHTKYVKRLERL